MLLTAALLGALTAGPARLAPPAHAPVPRHQDEEIERLMRAATTGRAVVRPQAARRLVELGPRGEERLLAELQPDGMGLAALGPPILEALGIARDPRLRAALWESLGDADFPWRPSSARAIAERPSPAEARRFVPLLDDVLGEVRTAAAEGLMRSHGPLPPLRAVLADEDERVRRAAAVALVRAGDRRPLWLLFEELARVDQWFERRSGQAARILAARALESLGVELHGLDPLEEPDASSAVAARSAIEADLTAMLGPRPELLPQQRAGRTAPARIGLELRSCREGELWLRWGADDQLIVGQGNPAVVPLPPGTTARLEDLLTAGLAAAGPRRMYGTPGCDLEQLLVRGASSETLLLVKGPEPVAGLRPEALQPAWRALVESLPTASPEAPADPRLIELRERALRILASLGGPVAPATTAR